MSGDVARRAPETTPGPPSRPVSRTAALLLAVATVTGHAFSYGFSLVLSRALGPAEFGALGALLGLSVVAAVPATALQTQVARVVAVTPSAATERRGNRLGWGVGAVLLVAMVLLAIPLDAVLRLDGPLVVLWLGLGMVAVSVLGARLGVLLGRGAFALLAVATVLVPALRLVGAGVAAATGMGVSGAVGVQSAATWLGLALVVWLVSRLPMAPEEAEAPGSRALLAGLVRAAWGLLGLFALASADVLLARHYLSDVDSGIYAVGAIGCKVVFWGTQFLALLVFPRVARGEGGRALVLRAAGLVAALGTVGALLAIPLAGLAVDVLVGSAYSGAAQVAMWFVVLGTTLALVQLFTYTGVAAGGRRFFLLVWITLVAQTAVIVAFAHDSMGQILAASVTGTGLLAALGALLVWRRSP